MHALPVWSHLNALLKQGANPNRAEPYRAQLSAYLQSLEIRDVAQVHHDIHDLRVGLRDRGVWCALSLLLGRHASDEDFTDFRGWLIAQGQGRYQQVLTNPDALAELELPLARDGLPAPFLKSVNATPGKVYLKKVGDDEELDAAIRASFEGTGDPGHADGDAHIGWLFWECPDAGELQRCLPQLWARYGTNWTGEPALADPDHPFAGFIKEAQIPGLGRVRIGDILIQRFDGSELTVLGISDLRALLGGAGEDDADFDEEDAADNSDFIARVRDSNGEIRCNQGLSHQFQRWPDEPDVELPAAQIGSDVPAVQALEEQDDVDLDAWEARDQAIQDRVAAAIGGDVRVIYSASDEDDEDLPIDNLDQVAYQGQIRFIEIDPLDDERFESDVLTDPTWMDLATVANQMMVTLGYQDHIYLEGFEVVRRPKGKPRVAEFVLGS